MMGPKVSEIPPGCPPEGRGWGALGWLDVAGSQEGLGKGVEGTLGSGGIIWSHTHTHTDGGALGGAGGSHPTSPGRCRISPGTGVLREVCVWG